MLNGSARQAQIHQLASREQNTISRGHHVLTTTSEMHTNRRTFRYISRVGIIPICDQFCSGRRVRSSLVGWRPQNPSHFRDGFRWL